MGRKRANKSNLPSRVYLKHGGFYFVSPENKWIHLGNDFHSAMIAWSKLLEPKERQSDFGEKQVKMKDVIDKYLIKVAIKKAEKTYKENLRQAMELKKSFGDVYIEEINPSDIEDYLECWEERGAPVSGNRHFALLSHIFNTAIHKWKFKITNPCSGVKKLEEPARERYLLDSELKEIRKNANPTFLCIIDFGYLTSLRISDILKLKLSDISEQGIFCQQKKTGMKQLFELTPELKRVIERTKGLHKPVASIYLFCTRKGTPYTYNGFKSIWNRIIEKSEVTDVHFHDIRAKALSDADDSGGDAQKLAGHESPSTTAIYLKKKKFVRVKSPLTLENVS